MKPKIINLDSMKSLDGVFVRLRGKEHRISNAGLMETYLKLVETLDAINQAARLEGLLLDPVYSGKGFAGLIGLVKANFFKPSDRILFLHTGGSAALFAYEEMLLSAQSAK